MTIARMFFLVKGILLSTTYDWVHNIIKQFVAVSEFFRGNVFLLL